jgi:hypothetical protein
VSGSPNPGGTAPGAPRPGAPGRTAAEIRRDIDLQQAELATSVVALRTRVNELTDWRSQIEAHREQLIKGAAVAGFVVGTVVAFRAFRRRR